MLAVPAGELGSVLGAEEPTPGTLAAPLFSVGVLVACVAL
jgi:hypothetical protein